MSKSYFKFRFAYNLKRVPFVLTAFSLFSCRIIENSLTNMCLSLPNSVYRFRSNAQSWRRAILERSDSQIGKFLTPVYSSNLKRKLSMHTSSFQYTCYSFSRKWPQSPCSVSYTAVHIKNLKVPDDFKNVSKLPSAGRIHMPKISEDLRGQFQDFH